jgi:hypothetical protein
MQFAQLQSNSGHTVALNYDFTSTYQQIVSSGQADCLIMASEFGFSPLGQAAPLISEELGIEMNDIQEAADWNRFQNEKVSIIGLSGKGTSKLRGAVLTAGGNSSCYKRFTKQPLATVGEHISPFPSKDFYYNVTYESIAYAALTIGARKLAISHLSASGNYHSDIATCTAEALAHFHDLHPGMIDCFSFVGCCIEVNHLRGIQRLNSERNSQHRPIKITQEERFGFEVITLNWK